VALSPEALFVRVRGLYDELLTAGGSECSTALSGLLQGVKELQSCPGAGAALILATLCLPMDSQWREVGLAGVSALPELIRAQLLTPADALAACTAFFQPHAAEASSSSNCSNTTTNNSTFHSVDIPKAAEYCVAALTPLLTGGLLQHSALQPLLALLPCSASSTALTASGGFILASTSGAAAIPAHTLLELTAPGPVSMTGRGSAAVAKVECRLSTALAAASAAGSSSSSTCPLQAALALRPALLRLALGQDAGCGEEVAAGAAAYCAGAASASDRQAFARVLVGEAGAAAAYWEYDAGKGTVVQVAGRCSGVLRSVLQAAGGGEAGCRQALQLAAGLGEWSLGDSAATVAEALAAAFQGVF